MKKFAIAFGLSVSALASLPAHASVAISVSGKSGGPLANANFTLGYSFSISSAIQVTNLGIYDEEKDGLVDSYAIGMWNNVGTLLGSATVGSGTTGTLIDNFRYAAIAPLSLAAGIYTIGAYYRPNTDSVVFPGNGNVFTTDPLVTYQNALFVSGNSLANPTSATGSKGYFGPNFVFSTGNAAVPEPGTWALFISGFGLVGMAIRRQRRTMVTARVRL